MPAGALVWNSEADGGRTPTARVELAAGVQQIIFSGAPDCTYRVRFGANLEFDMGFRGWELSTVLWPQELPEPSIAASGAGTSVTAMPELASGVYFLDVSDHGAPMLAEPTPAHACPWGIAIETTR